MDQRKHSFFSVIGWMLLAASLSLVARTAEATNISLAGNHGYRISGANATITADRIQNETNGTRSGLLTLQLWAFPAPYTGSGQSGYLLASHDLGYLNGGEYHRAVASGTVAFSAPPAGTWYVALLVREQGRFASTVAYGVFPNLLRCSASGCDGSDQGYVAQTTPDGTPAVVGSLTPISPAVVSSFTFTGTVVDERRQPVSGARVYFVANGNTYSATTDDAGGYRLEFDPTNMPTALAYWVTKTGFVPLANNLTLSGSGVDAGTLTLEALGANTVLIEVAPELHHLGDSRYRGSINSQFQRANAEGTAFTRGFNVSSSHLGSGGAQLTLLGKGLQHSNRLTINARLVGYLNTAPSDGSFGNVSFQVPMAFFVAGANTLQIESVLNGSGDYDDFEITNVVIRFAGGSTSGGGATAGAATRPDCFFAWAERRYPELFAPAIAETKSLGAYTYRYYETTRAYLAVSSADQNAYYLGPLSGNALLNLGPAGNWYASSGCG